MEFISDFNKAAALDVISFVKEVVEKFPDLRAPIVKRLVATLGEVRAGKVFRSALWIVGEYSMEVSEIREAWKRIRSSLGEIPIVASEQRLLDDVSEDGRDFKEQVNGHAKPSAPTGSRKVLADGTYATESALTSQSGTQAKLAAIKAAQKPPLRQLVLDGEFYLTTMLASAITKLVMRHSEISKDSARTNALRAEAMLIMISIIRAGQSQFARVPIDEDSTDRIMVCVKALAEFSQKKDLESVFLEDTRLAFRAMVQLEEKKRAAEAAVEKAKSAVQVDDVVPFRQLARKGTDGADEMELDVEKATGGDSAGDEVPSKLSRIVQLTGFSDPVYAEAYVQVHQFDIILDVLLVNQTTETLQNLSVEFSILGDLKVVERPVTQNLGPHDFHNVQSTVKVSSTDTGVIFGNIVYDGPSSTESKIVILNDVHVDVMDYIQPANCTETQFRTMWTEFEWENKVNINSKASSLRTFLTQLMDVTHMSCLTPEASLQGDCQFLSANLYARSIFGTISRSVAPQTPLLFSDLAFWVFFSYGYQGANSLAYDCCRRGRACESQHREAQRGRTGDRLRAHPQPVAGSRSKSGRYEGIEQNRRGRCLGLSNTRTKARNVVSPLFFFSFFYFYFYFFFFPFVSSSLPRCRYVSVLRRHLTSLAWRLQEFALPCSFLDILPYPAISTSRETALFYTRTTVELWQPEMFVPSPRSSLLVSHHRLQASWTLGSFGPFEKRVTVEL